MTQHFAVLFSRDEHNRKDLAYAVLLRQFTEKGLGEGISILEEGVMPAIFPSTFLLLVAAPDAGLVEAALKPCAGHFKTKVLPVEPNHRNDHAAAKYAVSCMAEPAGADALPFGSPGGNPESRCRLDFGEGAPYTSIWMVDADSQIDAVFYVASQQPGMSYGVSDCWTARTFLEKKPMAAEKIHGSVPAPFPAEEGELPVVSIYNESDTNLLYKWNLNLFPYQGYQNQVSPYHSTPAKSQLDFNTIGKLMAWSPNSIPSTFRYYDPGGYRYVTVPSTVPDPDLVLVPPAGIGQIRVNLPKNKNFHVHSPMWVLLNEILYSATAPWPEDHYTGGQKSAYDYFLSNLPSKPKDGNLNPGMITNIHWPDNGNFSEADFRVVQDHLRLECIYFEDAFMWFGTNGIFNAINSHVTTVATLELTSAASLMSVPPDKSIVLQVLDVIFGAIASIVSIIPVYGSAIAAVINISWSIAETMINNIQPGGATEPIQATIARLSNLLSLYLGQMLNAVGSQHAMVKSDWGKLKAFGEAKESGRISETDFGMGRNMQHELLMPQNYIDAARAAWSQVFYKSLFKINYSIDSWGELVNDETDLKSNPWNPAGGQYTFIWALPAMVNSDDSHRNFAGYIQFASTTNAPGFIMSAIFSPASALAADPFEFFVGYNGWPKTDPSVFLPGLHILPPVISIGHTTA